MRFNYNDDRKYRLKKYEQPDYFPKYRLPFPLDETRNGNIESPYTSENENLAERLNQLKKFEEVIDFERVQLMQQNHRANAEHRQQKHRLEVDMPKSFKPPNLLEEARVYAQDDDFRFVIDDNEEGNVQDIIGQPKFNDELDTDTPSTSEREHIMENSRMGHMDHTMGESDDEDDDSENMRFKGINVMPDPWNFAYAPSDPRFYRKASDIEVGKCKIIIKIQYYAYCLRFEQ